MIWLNDFIWHKGDFKTTLTDSGAKILCCKILGNVGPATVEKLMVNECQPISIMVESKIQMTLFKQLFYFDNTFCLPHRLYTTVWMPSLYTPGWIHHLTTKYFTVNLHQIWRNTHWPLLYFNPAKPRSHTACHVTYRICFHSNHQHTCHIYLPETFLSIHHICLFGNGQYSVTWRMPMLVHMFLHSDRSLAHENIDLKCERSQKFIAHLDLILVHAVTCLLQLNFWSTSRSQILDCHMSPILT